MARVNQIWPLVCECSLSPSATEPPIPPLMYAAAFHHWKMQKKAIWRGYLGLLSFPLTNADNLKSSTDLILWARLFISVVEDRYNSSYVHAVTDVTRGYLKVSAGGARSRQSFFKPNRHSVFHTAEKNAFLFLILMVSRYIIIVPVWNCHIPLHLPRNVYSARWAEMV